MPKSVSKITVAPAYEPVAYAEVLEWLRLDSDIAQPTLVAQLIKTFRERAETLTLRDFVQRTRCLYLDDWPWHGVHGVLIELPHPPLIEVVTFKYIDTDGVLQTMDAADYSVHTEQEPGFIIPAWEETWPTIRRVPDAIQVTYKSGYAPVGSPSDEEAHQTPIPAALKTWMEVNLAALHDNREAFITGTILTQLPRSLCDGLLDGLIVGRRMF